MYELEFRRRACARISNGEHTKAVAAKLGVAASTLRRWRSEFRKQQARFQLWKIAPCGCNHASCNTHSIEGPVSGCFYQGCGWGKADAEKIVAILNKHWRS